MKRILRSLTILLAILLPLSACGREEKPQNPAYENIFEEIYADLDGMKYMTERVPRLSSYVEYVYGFDPEGTSNSSSIVRYHAASYQTYPSNAMLPDTVYSYEVMAEHELLVHMQVSCNRKTKTLIFTKQTRHSETKFSTVEYVYSLEDQTLTYKGDREDGDTPDPFIYAILEDWVLYNGAERGLSYATQFEKDEWGSFELMMEEVSP